MAFVQQTGLRQPTMHLLGHGAAGIHHGHMGTCDLLDEGRHERIMGAPQHNGVGPLLQHGGDIALQKLPGGRPGQFQSLHPLERQVLVALKKVDQFSEIVKETGLEVAAAMRGVQWLGNRKLVELVEKNTDIIELDSNGKLYLKKGLPEKRFLSAIEKKELTNLFGKKKELELRLTSMKQHRKYCRYYDEAVELSRLMTEWCLKLPEGKRFRICSGGGFGSMEAANRGAFEAGGESIGLNISLPFENNPNPYITPKFNFEFHYFYMRKLWFMYYAKALVVFPGGFGTLDELFELLTLVQTGKITKLLLIVLYGELYWKNIINFNGLLEAGMISEKDLPLFSYVNNPKAAFNFLKDQLPEHLV